MYSIGKLAEISNCTVRTLRYYDEIDLLKPTKTSIGGHRYYDQDAITKLHHILFLKDLGLPLETIQETMKNQKWPLKEALLKRLEILKMEQERLKRIELDIHSILQVMELEGTTNWEHVFKTISVSSGNLEEKWGSYFSKNEQQLLKKLPTIGADTELVQQLIELVQDIRKYIHLSPKSTEAQDLARRWVNLVDSMFEGNDSLARKVWKISYEENNNIGFYQFDKEIITYIEQAISYLYKTNKEG